MKIRPAENQELCHQEMMQNREEDESESEVERRGRDVKPGGVESVDEEENGGDASGGPAAR